MISGRMPRRLVSQTWTPGAVSRLELGWLDNFNYEEYFIDNS